MVSHRIFFDISSIFISNLIFVRRIAPKIKIKNQALSSPHSRRSWSILLHDQLHRTWAIGEDN